MRTSFHHQSEAQPPNGPLTAGTSPDTPSTTPATQSGLCEPRTVSVAIHARKERIVSATSAVLTLGRSSVAGVEALDVVVLPLPAAMPDRFSKAKRQTVKFELDTRSAASSWSGTRQVLFSITKHAMRRSADEIGATSI
jgi:hypothetical protein